MTSFEELKEKPDKLLSLTGYTLEEFTELSPHFTKCFLAYVQTHTLTGKPRKKRQYKPYKNSSFDTFEDMLLFILIYLREAPKQELFGVLFGMSQPLANRWIHILLPILNQALAVLEALPSREALPAPMCDVSEVSTQSQEGDVSEISTQSQEGELFFS
ncbi:MAG: transposase family protein [Candidatus Omnitrophica bacterium]|nr:transposase family protein [Candidatus Omnitrophota bacterium]